MAFSKNAWPLGIFRPDGVFTYILDAEVCLQEILDLSKMNKDFLKTKSFSIFVNLPNTPKLYKIFNTGKKLTLAARANTKLFNFVKRKSNKSFVGFSFHKIE